MSLFVNSDDPLSLIHYPANVHNHKSMDTVDGCPQVKDKFWPYVLPLYICTLLGSKTQLHGRGAHAKSERTFSRANLMLVSLFPHGNILSSIANKFYPSLPQGLWPVEVLVLPYRFLVVILYHPWFLASEVFTPFYPLPSAIPRFLDSMQFAMYVICRAAFDFQGSR